MSPYGMPWTSLENSTSLRIFITSTTSVHQFLAIYLADSLSRAVSNPDSSVTTNSPCIGWRPLRALPPLNCRNFLHHLSSPNMHNIYKKVYFSAGDPELSRSIISISIEPTVYRTWFTVLHALPQKGCWLSNSNSKYKIKRGAQWNC